MKISVFYDHILEAAEQYNFSEEDVLKQISECKIDGVEINYDFLNDHFEKTISLLKKYNYSVSCIYQFYNFESSADLTKAKAHVDLAKKVGAKKILVVPGFLNKTDTMELKACGFDKEEVWSFMKQNKSVQNIKEALIKIVEYASSKNIKVTLEDFDSFNAPFATSAQLLYFMQNVPGVRCTFDTGNFAFSNENVEESFPLLKNYISHVNAKDRGVELNKPELKNNKGLASCSTGSGYIPIDKIISELKKIGYEDYIVIEHFGAKNQIEAIKKSAEFLTMSF